MSFEPRDDLRHIVVDADYLIGASAGLSFETFAADATPLIHDYFGVDFELVWDVVQNRIPELRRQLTSILAG